MEWSDMVFGSSMDPEVGQRLGIQYIRASQPTIDVTYQGDTMTFHQESMGIMAISGVVWDAGLLMVDFLVQSSLQGGGSFDLGYAMDIGCGTGIGGISALKLGAEFVLFTDTDRLYSFELNMEELPEHLQSRHKFESYRWKEGDLPLSFVTSPDQLSTIVNMPAEGGSAAAKPVETINEPGSKQVDMVWDTVICSDLLYEEKSHSYLLSVLRKLRFKKAIFSYKKRHSAPEKLFFEKLNEWCNIRVVDPATIQLVNLPRASLAHLYIIIAEPK